MPRWRDGDSLFDLDKTHDLPEFLESSTSMTTVEKAMDVTKTSFYLGGKAELPLPRILSVVCMTLFLVDDDSEQHHIWRQGATEPA